MPRMTCLPDGKEVEVDATQTLLEAALQTGIPFSHECDGAGDCCTCRVLVLEGLEFCSPPSAIEQARARQLGFEANVRLACQTRAAGDATIRRLVIDDEATQTIPQEGAADEDIEAEKSGRRNRELSILNAIARELNRSVDMDQILRTALAQVADLFDLQTGWVWLLREETGESYLAAAQNLPPALAENPHLMEGRCYCLDTYRAGDMRGAANVNVVTCSRLHNLVDGTDGLRFHASVPLYAHGRKLGVLNVASGNWRRLSSDDLRLLYTVGDLLSIAIERARLFGRSVQMGAVEERYRLAREIHDTLGQGLAAILLRLESVDALLEADSERERVRQTVRQVLDLARANLEEARRSVLDLRAAPLEGRTLAEALAGLAEEVSNREGLRVRFEATGGGRPLPVRVEAGLYRIAQEALTNAVQHAEARQGVVRLVTTLDQVQFLVEDDGRGFDPSEVPKGCYGLIGLNERAKLLGGSLRLDSSPGAGTRLEVTIPLKAKP